VNLECTNRPDCPCSVCSKIKAQVQRTPERERVTDAEINDTAETFLQSLRR